MSGNSDMKPFDEPKDVCECGDYRSSHSDDGYGPCRLCSWLGPTHCAKFRLDKNATKDQRRRILETK